MRPIGLLMQEIMYHGVPAQVEFHFELADESYWVILPVSWPRDECGGQKKPKVL